MNIEDGENPLNLFMNPRTVAIIGASNNPASAGHIIIKNLINGYQGLIYPVNPKYDNVAGLKCYSKVSDIDDEIDVAILAVPSVIVPDVLKDCGEKGVKNVIIIASGFREIGSLGEEIDRRTIETARRYGIRILGPNTTGIINMSNGFTSTFVKLPAHIKYGNVSLVVQTGIFAATLFRWILTSENFGISKVIGLGNKIDIDDVDSLQYLSKDPDTKVILIYMEGIKRGREFYEEARKISKYKPIVLVKSARTPYGVKASESHTGSLAVSDKIFDAMCKQAGIIRASNIEEAIDIVKILSFYGWIDGNKIGVASYSGAECVMASDAVYENDLILADIDDKTLEEIADYAPPYWPKNHPIDLGPIMETDDPLKTLMETLRKFLMDKRPDIYLFILPVIHRSEGTMIETGGIESNVLYDNLLTIKNEFRNKKIIVVLDGSLRGYIEGKKLLEGIRIPVYPTVERAVKAISKSIKKR